jgi:hypothetical protein
MSKESNEESGRKLIGMFSAEGKTNEELADEMWAAWQQRDKEEQG